MSEKDVASLREQAFKLSCHDQFRLASFVAENVGYVLAPDPLTYDEPEPTLEQRVAKLEKHISPITPALDAAIQDEIEHGPKDIMK